MKIIEDYTTLPIGLDSYKELIEYGNEKYIKYKNELKDAKEYYPLMSTLFCHTSVYNVMFTNDDLRILFNHYVRKIFYTSTRKNSISHCGLTLALTGLNDDAAYKVASKISDGQQRNKYERVIQSYHTVLDIIEGLDELPNTQMSIDIEMWLRFAKYIKVVQILDNFRGTFKVVGYTPAKYLFHRKVTVGEISYTILYNAATERVVVIDGMVTTKYLYKAIDQSLLLYGNDVTFECVVDKYKDIILNGY